VLSDLIEHRTASGKFLRFVVVVDNPSHPFMIVEIAAPLLGDGATVQLRVFVMAMAFGKVFASAASKRRVTVIGKPDPHIFGRLRLNPLVMDFVRIVDAGELGLMQRYMFA
jgi:hypothetical protein